MNFWQDTIKIGTLRFPRFIGGPLDGITDSPFRKLVRHFSANELLYTEMRHVALVAHDRGTKRTLCFDQLERPLSYQIAANSTNFIQKACEKILTKGVDCIDLNVGCPSKQVTGSGSGSALMGDIKRLATIVRFIRKVVSIPFTVKIRAGFKKQNAQKIAIMLEDCGVDAIAIHPRLQTERFEGRPNYALVEQVKKVVSIPVILSGGVINFKIAKMLHEQTGVDGFLIGRGLWSRPWKLLELKAHSHGKEYMVSVRERMRYALKHLELVCDYYGRHGLFIFRKHIPLYMQGLQHASQLRRKLVTMTEIEGVRGILQERLAEHS